MSRPALSACGATGSSRGLPACSGAAGVSRGSEARWVRPERCLNEAGSALMGTPLNRGETNERGAGTARHKQTVPSCLNEDVPSRSSVKCNFSFFYNNSAAPPPSLAFPSPFSTRSVPDPSQLIMHSGPRMRHGTLLLHHRLHSPKQRLVLARP